jgi:hypothetical protein
MGWTPVELPGGKPVISGLGPYREAGAVKGGAALVRPWRATTTGGIWSLTLFAIAWNGMVAVFATSAARSGVQISEHSYTSVSEALQHDPSIACFALFPLFGIVVGYLAVAIWINSTRLDLIANTLTIRRGPLPWRGRLVTMDTSTIKQFYVQEYVSHEENEVPAKAFRVKARLSDREDILIDLGMRVYADARALEQWLEKQLGIVDQPVAGEVPRPS